MYRQSIIIILSLSLFVSCSSTNKSVRTLTKLNHVDEEFIGYDCHTRGDAYLQYIKLRDKSTTDELLKLTHHRHPVIRAYSSWALIDKKYSQFMDIITAHQKDTAQLTINSCDEVYYLSVANFILSRIHPSNCDTCLKLDQKQFDELQKLIK